MSPIFQAPTGAGLISTHNQTPIARLAEAEEQKRFLRFSLGAGWVGVLALEQMREVIRIRVEDILPIPALAPWVLGIHTWRGDIVWILDLRGLLGLKAISEASDPPITLSALVLASKDQVLGLGVERVETIEGQDPTALQPLQPGMVPESLASYLNGYFIDTDGKMLLQLDGEVISRVLGEKASTPSSHFPSL